MSLIFAYFFRDMHLILKYFSYYFRHLCQRPTMSKSKKYIYIIGFLWTWIIFLINNITRQMLSLFWIVNEKLKLKLASANDSNCCIVQGDAKAVSERQNDFGASHAHKWATCGQRQQSGTKCETLRVNWIQTASKNCKPAVAQSVSS